MNRFRKLCAAIVVGIVAQLMLVQPAQAHNSWEYYIHWWPDYIFIPTYFDENYPGGAYRSRVVDGANQWNNATSTGIEPDVSNFGSRNIWDGYEPFSNPCVQPAGILVVHYEALDPWSTSALGGTFDCTNWVTQQYLSSTVVVDSDTDRYWYTGTGDAGIGQYDLWSLASHELGHATGF